MRRLVFVVSMLCALVGAAVTAGPTFADGPNGTVLATVQVSVGPCINVAPTTFTFAPEGFSSAGNTRTTIPAATSTKPVVTNCSDRSETILAKGGEATGSGSAWQLVSSFDCSGGSSNQYKHQLKQQASGGAHSFLLTETPQPWEAAVSSTAGASARTVDSLLTMPCTGSDGLSTTRTIPIYLTAVIP